MQSNRMPFKFNRKTDNGQSKRISERCKNIAMCGSGFPGVSPECMAEIETCMATNQPVPRDFLPVTDPTGRKLGPLESYLADPDNYTATGRPKYLDPKLIPVMDWDHNIPPDNTAIIMNGKRGSGKSFCCRDYLYKRRNRCTGAYCFTKTRFNDFWQSSAGGPIPFKRVYDAHKPDMIHDRLNEWLARAEWVHDNPEEADRQGICQDDVFIFEDCAVGSDLRRLQPVEALYTNGRHIGKQKTSCIAMVQRPTAMSTLQRDNTEFVFLFRTDNMKVKKLYHEEYMSELPFRTACDLLGLHTWAEGEKGKRCCLVLDVRAHIPVDDKYYVCVAEDCPAFILGNKKFIDKGTGGEGLCITPAQQRQTADRSQPIESCLFPPKVATRETSEIDAFMQGL